MPIGNLAFAASFAIIPMIAFFNLWPNWGATLYGEVRGSTDYKRNFWGMGLAVIVTTVLAVIFLGLIAKTLGWDFYNRANGAFWSYLYGVTDKAPPLPFWPYPGLFAAFLTNSRVHPAPGDCADEPLVVRLVGHGVHELDTRDFRRRVRSSFA